MYIFSSPYPHQTHTISTQKVLIATGSRPRHPIDLPEADPLFVDSDVVFQMDSLPQSLIVLGGGIIGCEYATMFAALGIQVTLMDRRNDILRMLDAEIGKTFSEYITEMGLTLALNNDISELKLSENGKAEVIMKDDSTVNADCIFYVPGSKVYVL